MLYRGNFHNFTPSESLVCHAPANKGARPVITDSFNRCDNTSVQCLDIQHSYV